MTDWSCEMSFFHVGDGRGMKFSQSCARYCDFIAGAGQELIIKHDIETRYKVVSRYAE